MIKRKTPLKRKKAWNPKRNKFGAKRTGSLAFGGRVFDSKGEKERAEQLLLMEKAGFITGLKLQPTVLLTEAEISYKPDFYYVENDGTPVYEDFKGVESERFRIIKKLWAHYGPEHLLITKKRGPNKFVVQKRITPKMKRTP